MPNNPHDPLPCRKFIKNIIINLTSKPVHHSWPTMLKNAVELLTNFNSKPINNFIASKQNYWVSRRCDIKIEVKRVTLPINIKIWMRNQSNINIKNKRIDLEQKNEEDDRGFIEKNLSNWNKTYPCCQSQNKQRK